MSELKPIVKESFSQYAGAVLQSRALVDVRDCLKPSARQIFYSMLNRKLVHKNPYKKTANAVGMAMADFYIHGDSSCEGVIMRAGQDFAMRYPLVEVKGNMGSLIESGNWAAMRYTESRLSPVSDLLFGDINKDTINEWRDNYDNTQVYPAVLPSKGYYNIVNGSMGIGIGMASSLPQFNIKDVNAALIKLLWNEDISFEEIYCAPDFATGAILLNENEVKESLKKGTGFSCKLRSVVTFDEKEKCFIVSEIPYGVYTNTICKQIEEIANGDDNPGIEKINDLTGAKPNLKIYLSKNARPDKVLTYLYKNTSLQYYYGINLTMLDNGRFPRVFTWKEALQAHLDHEKEVYINGFNFDLKKINDRIHIIDGLLICMASIDEVVKTIKSSASAASASKALQEKFLLDEVQAKAVLDMKLSRLAHLEVEKLENELASLEKEKTRIESILNNKELLYKEIENGLIAVSKKLGDERRTKIMNISTDEDDEPIEIKQLQISLTNCDNIFVNETSSLYTQRRGGVGSKLKMSNGEYVVSTLTAASNDLILFFTRKGNFYHCNGKDIDINSKLSIHSLVNAPDYEEFISISCISKDNTKNNIIFITKNGYIKKSLLNEYNIKRSGGIKAISLSDGDEIVNVICTNEEKLGILTELGNFLIVETKDIRPIGRVSLGIKGIKLNNGDSVISSKTIKGNIKTILSISGNGLCKQTDYNQFSTQTKNTKGSKIQKITNGDWMADFLPISDDSEIIIASSSAAIRIRVSEIPNLSKGAQGVKTLKINSKDNIIGISKL